MLTIENAQVFGFQAAIRGMQNPKNSWAKSDSGICFDTIACHTCRADRNHCKSRMENKEFVVGYDDMNLMTRLRNAGTDHRKFLRMIHVQLDVTAPLYWWKEADQYKVGTVTDSCSTMHKIHAKEFTIDDFSYEHLTGETDGLWVNADGKDFMCSAYDFCAITCDVLNFYRKKFLETGDKRYWWQLIQLLPSSFNQRRTWDLNYEVLANIYHARRNHKLDEWHTLCNWIETLPYAEELICG